MTDWTWHQRDMFNKLLLVSQYDGPSMGTRDTLGHIYLGRTQELIVLELEY